MKRTRWLLAILSSAAILGAASAPATLLITTVGLDSTTMADWRTTTTPKPFDGDHDGLYGTLGYYLFAPSAIGSAFGNNAFGTVFSAPDQKGGVLNNGSLTLSDTGVLGTHLHASYGSWSPLDNPTFAPGPSVPDESSGYGYVTGPAANTLYDLVSVTVGAGMPSSFRLGVLRTDSRPEDYSFVLTSASSTAAIDLGTVSPGGVGYAFFDLSGVSPGDTFTIGVQTAGSLANMGLAGITVDAIVPEPSTILLLGAGGLLLWRRRSRK